MKTKKCKKCNVEKCVTKFYRDKDKSDGLYSSCKECKNRLYCENKEEILEYNHNYYWKNRDEIRKRRKKRQKKANAAYKRKRDSDPLFKLAHNMRVRTGQAVKGLRYSDRTETILGCSFESLKKHLETQFCKGMSWENYGEWHVDHIKPLNTAISDEELISLCHYSNLQPLWAEDNLKKERGKWKKHTAPNINS